MWLLIKVGATTESVVNMSESVLSTITLRRVNKDLLLATVKGQGSDICFHFEQPENR